MQRLRTPSCWPQLPAPRARPAALPGSSSCGAGMRRDGAWGEQSRESESFEQSFACFKGEGGDLSSSMSPGFPLVISR